VNPSTPNSDSASPGPPAVGSVVLIGFMGTGKSTIGRRLADRAGLPFEDTDDLIVGRAGLPIPEIFRLHGETAFRDVEHEVLAGLDPTHPRILSTGGGIVLQERNRALLRRLGFVVWLTADEAEILRRVSRNRNRPLVQGDNPRETIRRLLAERAPLYRATADWSLETTGLPVPETVKRIAARADAHRPPPSRG
jgi:shikimate kinase